MVARLAAVRSRSLAPSVATARGFLPGSDGLSPCRALTHSCDDAAGSRTSALRTDTLKNASTYSAAHVRLISGVIRRLQISEHATRRRSLSEDELTEMLRDGIQDVLTNETDTFANVLRELGWSVQPSNSER